jgi:hypothetical protein
MEETIELRELSPGGGVVKPSVSRDRDEDCSSEYLLTDVGSSTRDGLFKSETSSHPCMELVALVSPLVEKMPLR